MIMPFNLKQALESGTAILFVGAGMGYNMIDSDGNPIPDGNNLAGRIASHFSVPTDGVYELQQVSQYVLAQKKGKRELNAFVKSCLLDAHPDQYMEWIPTIRWKAIFTTNYDNAIEEAYDKSDSAVQEYVRITHLSGFRDYSEATDVPIIHLHGSLFDDAKSEIVITSDDYAEFSTKCNSLFDILKFRMSSSCILYTGYSHNDTNFRSIVSELKIELSPLKLAVAYRIDPKVNAMDELILKEKNIETINCTYKEFVEEARLKIITEFFPNEAYRIFEKNMPRDFQSAFDNNQAATVRFLHSWEYVNRLNDFDSPDVYNFVRGNKASWPIIFNEKYFVRSIEDEVYGTLLDYATDPKGKTRVCTITGSAGYGISTLLMVIVKKLIVDKVGKVFFHQSGNQTLSEGDVFFACNTFDKDRLFFVIDNAADYSKEIKSLITHAKQSNTDVIIILADRYNELFQERLNSIGSNFAIQPLTDIEIESLIDFLSQNNELNKLQYLDREHQISAIKQNYSRELLVAIREATEGKNFDAIIEDEFWGVKDPICRKIYALVACFHQHSALLRVELLSHLLGVPAADIYEKIRDGLQGIVYDEPLNIEFGEFAFRTRHRYIATSLWNSCISLAERDQYIHSAIDSLNIAYPVDKKAFENFYRSDQIVDDLVSLESKMRFFETSSRKDPDNPFVLQHFARMLLREKNYKTALSTIESSIKVQPTITSLYHTKGCILMQMAIVEPTLEIARRFLGQSKAAFEVVLKLNDRDSYVYQGLSSLYLSWAKKVTDEDERTLYLANAQDIIKRGFQKCSDKESIWIEASKIDSYLGNMPDQINSLIEAVKAAPKSIISRYLLAKAYNISGDYPKSKAVLKEITLETAEEYQVNMEYARSMLLSGDDLPSAIAILYQSTLYGYSDPRFIATLGGLLFLNKEFTEAEKVFSQSTSRAMINTQKVMFKPIEYGIDTTFDAKVSYVGNGYSYMAINGYQDIHCYSSKYKGTILKKGLFVKVVIQFTPKYPIAEILT